MANVAWAPPGSTPALTSVSAPLGAQLSRQDYLELLTSRVHELLKAAGKDQAASDLESLIPNIEFLDQPPNQWAALLVQENELVRTKLGEDIPGHPWPLKVDGQNPQAEKALAQVDLPTWLLLAIPRD